MELYTIKNDIKVDFTEKKSRFLAHAFSASDESSAIEYIDKIKEEHSAATHNVWAFSLRQFSRQRFSDDGEPQGTAGMPVLSVIKNNNLVDVCIVVTRYFGGILLGAGGLVRAYSKSAALAVEKAGKTPLIIITEFELVYSYEMSKTIQKYLEQYSVDYSPPVFLEKISLTGRLPSEVFDSFSKELKNIYYKDLEINIIKNEYSRSIWER